MSGFVPTAFVVTIALAGGLMSLGCGKRNLERSGTGGAGIIGTPGAGGGLVGTPTGAGGAGSRPDPCTGPADPRMAVAPQRTRLLTSTQILNMIRTLTDDTEANAIVADEVFQVTSG